jgi:hypothetical protein
VYSRSVHRFRWCSGWLSSHLLGEISQVVGVLVRMPGGIRVGCPCRVSVPARAYGGECAGTGTGAFGRRRPANCIGAPVWVKTYLRVGTQDELADFDLATF